MIASPNVAQSQSGPTLLGTWRLVSYEARDSEGRVHYPLGENVSGLLVYDGGGNMSAHVMRTTAPYLLQRIRLAVQMQNSVRPLRITVPISAPTPLTRRGKLWHIKFGVLGIRIGLATIRSVISSSTAVACYCPLRRSYGMGNHSSTFWLGNASH